jgi:hypothetical protein
LTAQEGASALVQITADNRHTQDVPLRHAGPTGR